MIKIMIRLFLYLWTRLAKENIDLAFEDGVTHQLSDSVEICWNHDNVTDCYNPT